MNKEADSRLYIGIDLSLRATGISILYEGRIDTSKTIKINGKGAKRINTIKRIIEDLLEIYSACRTDLCAIEGYAFVKKARGQYEKAELHGTIIDMLYEKGIIPAIVPPTTLKKFATGSGKASKADMIEYASSKYAENKIDDNQADSIALAFYIYENNQNA